jgi:hypothetical protein
MRIANCKKDMCVKFTISDENNADVWQADCSNIQYHPAFNHSTRYSTIQCNDLFNYSIPHSTIQSRVRTRIDPITGYWSGYEKNKQR